MTSHHETTVLSRAFEHAHEAFVAIDADGAIAAWNPAAERLYGYPAAEAVGRPLEILYLPAEQPRLARWIRSRSESGDGRGEWIERQRHKSGRELRVALRLAHLDAPEGEPGFLLCAVDVSCLEQAEEDQEETWAALAASRSELRQVAARLVAGEEEARRRVARELHDDFGQRLPALSLDLEALHGKLAEDDPRGGELGELEAVIGDLKQLAEDLRRLSHDLHPLALDRFGLAEALRDLCAEVERRYGIPVRASVRDVDRSLPPEFAVGLYRVAQEALANAVRHARARLLHVSLVVASGRAHLVVADDGVGFDPDEAWRAAGLGLAHIEERVRLLGGRCRIASAPGAGTEIEVGVPLPPPEPSGSEPAVAGDPSRQHHIGPYRLLEVLGTGSFATVLLAEEPEPLGRKVVLKLHRGSLPGRRETLRFKAEQQALARLHHPAIAEVYEARTTEEGDPYIVMEYTPGLPITEYCDRYGLDLGQRLRLFATVCEGMRHAHRKGILHRNLKPSNILVMEEGGIAQPKIIDFGFAKGLDHPLAEGTVWPAEEVASNPAYLAPEALADGEIDTRSDVYSLGVVLYELLVGALPFETRKGDLATLLEVVRLGEAPPPSHRLSEMEPDVAAEVARLRGFGRTSLLRRRLSGDLDRVVSKALAIDPAARYPTVDDLGKEVERMMRGEPIEAGPSDVRHQIGRLVRRNRRLAATVALVVIALAGGLVTTALQSRRAEREAMRADAVARFLEELFQASGPRQARGAPPDARELLQRGAERLGTELQDQPLTRARLLDALGGIHTELGFFDEARPLLEEALALRERLRGAEHPEVAATLVRLGALAHYSGQGDAEPFFRRALTIRETRLGTDHPEVADVLNKLGAALAARGRFDEAETALRRSLTIGERLWGENDPKVAKVVHNLSGIAFYRGRIDEAERLLERALTIREATLAEDDLDLAGSREALALVRRQQGRPAEAARLLERLAATAERVYGPEHPELARTLLNLGLARRDLGEHAAARELFERTVAINEKALAPDHPQLVRALAVLAEQYLLLCLHTEAEPLYRRLRVLHESGVPYEDWENVLAQADELRGEKQ